MTRLWQVLIVALGAVVALVMVFLGLWQMEVFQNQGDSGARERIEEPAIPLDDVAPVAGEITEGYGRTVTFTGEYVADQQLLIPIEGRPGEYRVLTALERPDGSVVPVVRGVAHDKVAPPPPPGVRDERGVLLASELAVDGDFSADEIGSVRLPELVRRWEQPLIGGYVTLPSDISAEHGLSEAPLTLPSQGGNSRNSGYALQWWVFAAAGLGFCIYIARDIGVKERKRALVAAGLAEAPENDDSEDDDL